MVGCGTSWFMAQAYAMLREQAGHGETDYFTPTHFPATRRYDRVVAITRSGTTTEILEVADRVSCPVVAITADPHTPIMQVADDTVVMEFADEKSVVQTVFATTTLMLLRASLGEDLGPDHQPGRARADPRNRQRTRLRRAVHLPWPGLGPWSRRRGGPKNAGSGPGLDRVLSADGIPGTARSPSPNPAEWCGSSGRPFPDWSTTWSRPAPWCTTSRSIPSPTWWPRNCSRYGWPKAGAWTRTDLGTCPGRSS